MADSMSDYYVDGADYMKHIATGSSLEDSMGVAQYGLIQAARNAARSPEGRAYFRGCLDTANDIWGDALYEPDSGAHNITSSDRANPSTMPRDHLDDEIDSLKDNFSAERMNRINGTLDNIERMQSGSSSSGSSAADRADDVLTQAGTGMVKDTLYTVIASAGGFLVGFLFGRPIGRVFADIKSHKNIRELEDEVKRLTNENRILAGRLNEIAAKPRVPGMFVPGAAVGLAVGGVLGYNKENKKNKSKVAELQERILSLELDNARLRSAYIRANKPLPAGVSPMPLLFSSSFTPDKDAESLKYKFKKMIPKVKIRAKSHEPRKGVQKDVEIIIGESVTELEPIDEGNVKPAIDSIMFSLESVSDNKIKSCSSLSKLRTYESKLNKLKNKYAKYLTRYKRKYQENKKNGTDQKLSIRFNGATISNPKAFMKQYGEYIKIINKRLKLVDKRREELRKRKGLPTGNEDKKLEEAGIPVLSDLDLQTVDHCIQMIDEALNAPDSEIFIIDEVNFKNMSRDDIVKYARGLEKQNAGYRSRISDYQTNEKRDSQTKREQGRKIQTAQRGQRQAEDKLERERKDREKSDARHEDQLARERKKYADLEQRLNDKRPNDPRYWDNPDSAPEPGTRPKDSLYDEPVVFDKARPVSGVNVGRAAIRNGYTGHKTFDKEIFTDMDMRKSNEAVPTFAKATIGFVIDETEEVVNRDILVGIKVYLHKVAAMDLISDIYNCIINKRKFLKFVKFISGEEKSLADLLFGFKELKNDALNTRGAGQWASAFRRRKRWSKMSIPFLMKNYTPNGTVVITMNEVQYIKDEYGIDIMRPDHVKMLMDASYLLGFVVIDQANEMCYITYDGHEGQFQQYTYAMLERETNDPTSRAYREMFRAMAR